MNASDIFFKLFDFLKSFGQLISKPFSFLKGSGTSSTSFNFKFGLIPAIVAIFILLFTVTGFIWDIEPKSFDVQKSASARAKANKNKVVIGYTTTATLIQIMETLLNKTGGYLSNDILPPGVSLDNMHNWEFGVLVQVRDMSRALRNDLSRSQSQSIEDEDLLIAGPQFHYNNDSWWLPATETEYRVGLKALRQYLSRLSEGDNAQFYARADNLSSWLANVEKRLGNLSQQLSASVGQKQITTNKTDKTDKTDKTVKTVKTTETKKTKEETTETGWFEVDDVFYEARGTAWALSHLFKAVEIDFADILNKKNALISLKQIIRELDSTQEKISSPMILNGDQFGFLANHSLVMANYISRANAAVIELRALLSQG